MARERRAEVVGAGFGGLAAAAALARRGWRVRVHERADRIRSSGAGIYLYDNGLAILEALGAADAALEGAVRVVGRQVREGERVVAESRLPPGQRTMCVARQRLVAALAAAARAAGAEIVLGSEAVGATPEGRLRLASGETVEGDLVVAADGVNSRLRDGLGLLARRRRLHDGAIRVMAERRTEEETEPGLTVEWWAGARRALYTPCSPDETYLALCARHDDARGVATPVDAESWAESFPALAPMLGRLAPGARYDRFEFSTLRAWSKGRVAVLGDAAHAMPPNIGQGAGSAMSNALALAAWLDRERDVGAALAVWERAERPLTAHTQRVSVVFGLPAAWPSPLRAAFFGLAGRSAALRRWRGRTASHRPDGLDLPAPAPAPAAA